MADSIPETTTLRSRIRGYLGATPIDHLSSFRVIYVAIFAFVVLYLFTVLIVEQLLDQYFRTAIAEAVRVSPSEGSVVEQIQSRVNAVARQSRWVRAGDVRVNVLVLGADGSFVSAGGGVVPAPTAFDPDAALREAERLLPAYAEVGVSVPHNALLANGILIFYGALLVTGLYRYTHLVSRRGEERLKAAVAAREAVLARTRETERELEKARSGLRAVEPTEREHVEEIRNLQDQRRELTRKLAMLEQHELRLRARAQKAVELEEECQTLEEMLQEQQNDLDHKDEELGELQTRLKRAAKGPSSSRTRDVELLARRLRALYKAVEVDDRAVQEIVALRDEGMKLKAEEAIKRLADDADHAAVRRKVGGLPSHLSIFELGFAGKGRIYYAQGRQRRFRILTVGAKNTQKTDLEYLSRIARDEL